MCGIAGFAGKGTKEGLEKMITTLKHRGPDSQKTEFFGPVGLAHARLSIIDVSLAAAQPMCNPERTLWIVFNGEIYNFRTLRCSLEAAGYAFQTASDTEVLLQAYAVYGVEAFSLLEGMFALAIYDSSQGQVILARDRLGKKPLYWTVSDGTLVFGSEIKALLAHPAVIKKLDQASLARYSLFGYVPTPYTIFENINKLAPGSYGVWKNGQFTKHVFWEVPMSKLELSFDDALMQLDGLLDASVKQRLVADVPLGVFLSGGLDSSAIAYYAQRNSAVPIKTFTIRFDEESFDESVYAAKLAKQVGTDHHVATVSAKEALACIPSLLASVDEPLADASLIPTFLLSRFARMEVTVALGGDGGDELFTGYPTFQAEKIEPLYRFLRGMFGTRLLTAIADSIPLTEKYLSLNFKLKRFLRGQDLPALYRHAVWMGSFAVIDFKDLFNQVVYNHIKNVPVFDVIEAYVTAPQLTSEQKLFLFYLRVYLMDGVLVKVDRASMLNGLEVRAPFLDYKLVAWASGLPHQYKMKGLTTKYILKKLMENKVPRDIVWRKKQGFAMPLARWLRHDLREWGDELLSPARLKQQGMYDVGTVTRLWNEHQNGRADHHRELWNLLVFQSWYSTWGS